MNSKNWVRWDSRCLKMQNYPCNINHGGTETINGCPFSPYRIVLFRLGRDPSTLYLILFRSRSWMHFLAKLFSFIYIEPILSYVFSVHQIIINLEAEHSMQPINFFWALELYGGHLIVLIVLLTQFLSTSFLSCTPLSFCKCSYPSWPEYVQWSFFFDYAARFLMEQAIKIREKHLLTVKYNSSFTTVVNQHSLISSKSTWCCSRMI